MNFNALEQMFSESALLAQRHHSTDAATVFPACLYMHNTD